MIDQIKKLADEAIRVQNKALMETNLRRISELCDILPADGCVLKTTGFTNPSHWEVIQPIEAGDVLVDADGKEHKIDEVVEAVTPKVVVPELTNHTQKMVKENNAAMAKAIENGAVVSVKLLPAKKGGKK